MHGFDSRIIPGQEAFSWDFSQEARRLLVVLSS